MTNKIRNFIILISIVFAFGIAFWIQQMRYSTMPEIPHTIVIGTAADYPPFSFKQNGIIVGFDIDVAVEAVKRLGKKSIIEDVPFELLIPQAMIGKVHVIAAGLSRTAEREKQLYFSKSYDIYNPLAILTKASMATGADLLNKRVVVTQGHAADAYVSKLQNIAIDRVPAIADAAKALVSDKADALITEAQTLEELFKEYGKESFSVVIIPEAADAISIAISQQYPELAQQLTPIIDQMHQDGTIDQLQQKWNIE